MFVLCFKVMETGWERAGEGTAGPRVLLKLCDGYTGVNLSMISTFICLKSSTVTS